MSMTEAIVTAECLCTKLGSDVSQSQDGVHKPHLLKRKVSPSVLELLVCEPRNTTLHLL